MSTPCTTCQPTPSCTEDLDRYSLQEDLFQFVIECPPGYSCSGIGVISLICCDGTEYAVTIEEGISSATRALIINQMAQQCLQRRAFCEDGGTGGGGDVDDPDNPLILYYSRAKNCSVICSDGARFTYHLRAGRYIGFNQATIDQLAQTEACRLARLHKLCLSELPDECTVGTAYSQRVRVSGAGASNIHYWSILSGTLPHGLEINGFPLVGGWVTGRSVLISGTPDTPGTSTFTIRVVAPDHCYMDKEYTIEAIGTATIRAYFKCDDATPITELDNQIGAENLIGTSAGTSVAGKIGTALKLGDGITRSFDSVVSDNWKFNTSFTVRFWYYVETATGGDESVIWTANPGQFTIFRWSDPFDTYFYFEVETDDGIESVQSPNVTIGGWHRVVCIFEDGVGLKIKIDNNAATSFLTASPLVAAASCNLRVRGKNDVDDRIDEIGLWEVALTDAQLLTDWNGGAGTTYP